MSSLPLFDPISLLNIHLPPRRGKLPLFWPHLLPITFSLKRVNCIEFSNENALLSQQGVHQVQNYNVLYYIKSFKAIQSKIYLITFKIGVGIWMLMDEINVTVWLCAKSPSFPRCKEGDLPLLNFSNLTCMLLSSKSSMGYYYVICWYICAVFCHTEQPFIKFLKILEFSISEIINSAFFDKNNKISQKMTVLAQKDTIW